MGDEENQPKKKKLGHNKTEPKEINALKIPKPNLDRCKLCKQYIDSVALYNGHPNNSTEEFVALTHERLSLFDGTEDFGIEQHDCPNHKITNFSVYDKNGHLCAFDAGLIESNVDLFFSGFLKPIYDDDPSCDNGIPAHDMGPINEWWMQGYDGGEKLPVGIATAYAEYYLMDPSPDYEPIFRRTLEKVNLSKMIIEFLLDSSWDNPTYEDLLEHIQASEKFQGVEDLLLPNAQFLCDQVVNYDNSVSEHEKKLISYPCMRSLVDMAGVTFQKSNKMRKSKTKGIKIKKGPVWSKATTTKLVKDVFESFFPDQIDDAAKDKALKKKRCGVCEACQNPDCGNCSNCKDMLKFGGSGRSKQACKTRICPNMAIMDAELSENEEEVKVKTTKKKTISKRILNEVQWLDEPICEEKGRKYHLSASIAFKKGNNESIKPGDFVIMNTENPNEPPSVALVVNMYEMALPSSMFHAHLFCRGTDTILGECSDPRELFAMDSCDDYPLGAVVRKATVEYRSIPKNWHDLGGEQNLPAIQEDDGKTFFYTKHYEQSSCRFVDFDDEIEVDERGIDECNSCSNKKERTTFDTPILNEDDEIFWRDEVYKIGTGIFLKPDAYKFKYREELFILEENKENNVDQVMFPEFWRKKTDTIAKGSNLDTPHPYIVAMIEAIHGKSKDLKIQVRIFYRPDDTGSVFQSYEKDLNFVYWTEELVTVSFDNTIDKCYLSFSENLENVQEWGLCGPNRFYFSESYDPKDNSYTEVPNVARRIGSLSRKGKTGGGKVKGKSQRCIMDPPPNWFPLESPFRCMEVFAGCGGLSEGLNDTGIVNTLWAIEREKAAAQAYRMNNPECKVFNEDCNDLLKEIMSGGAKSKHLPCKGEVEMLVGGPPCQGFSGMNRFNAGQYSAFKNSLVASYLSYCEYYRPKYFVLENVRNFVTFKKSIVLKLTMRCLLAMGYQVTAGILQAGHYGVPQTRRRLIIMAAAPGYVLPKYPEPTHVFSKRNCQLSFVVDGVRYESGIEKCESAPYRTVCVRDALADLPNIKNGWNKREMEYDSEAMSHYQRMMRGKDGRALLRDHICKEMAPIVEYRISQIPTYPGSDWRDLPNISVRLNDGTKTSVLRYPYRTKKQKANETPKGVCSCARGGPCDPADRQVNTLIPWCLPHTADRHNHWAALYGRLEWDGFFGTTITNPEPMGKQGRVLHPEQNRVVSVRECARSQGFPDHFQFCGSIMDKHRQVGNAVPPPLGAAIGMAIRKAFVITKI